MRAAHLSLLSVTPGLTRGSAAFGLPQEAKPRIKSGATMFVGYRRYPSTRHAELVSASISRSARSVRADRLTLKQVQGDDARTGI